MRVSLQGLPIGIRVANLYCWAKLLIFGVAAASVLRLPAVAGEAYHGQPLHNGIVLPKVWPPQRPADSNEPQPVPYLEQPPAVIPIDDGRQLLVDDFLVESTTLKRSFHRPVPHPGNPILRPDRPWEESLAMPYSDGVWYDPQDQQFKMWYMAGTRTTCYARSRDGVQWEKPQLDVRPGTNIVLEAPRDSTTVWLDLAEKDPARRYKLVRAASPNKFWQMLLHYSPDGIHWGPPVAASGPSWDRTTIFYNPFRQVWAYSVRGHRRTGEQFFRLRLYKEAASLVEAGQWKFFSDDIVDGKWAPGEPVFWAGPDRLDPRHPEQGLVQPPQLYNLDALAYESLLLGFFSIWQGPDNRVCAERKMEKRNEVLLAFSRDGFHWHRPDRKPFLGVDDRPGAWNRGNVQSVGGGCLVVGDRLFLYYSGRSYGEPAGRKASTGLAVLRRDGFASLDAGPEGGSLTTRPILFHGKHLFVNVCSDQGELQVEAIDASDRVIAPFTREGCSAIRTDSTRTVVRWDGASDLSSIVGRPVRFRFHLRNGRLYAFWTSSDLSGASNGYLAAGGPGLSGTRDAAKPSAHVQ